MSTVNQFWFLHKSESKSIQILLPAFCSLIMFVASIFPWLTDPLGKVYSAWSIPVDMGWGGVRVFSYGFCCFCCAVYAMLIALASWRDFPGSRTIRHRYITAGVLCLVPPLLFTLQYTYSNIYLSDVLAQHKLQSMLIIEHFGYDGQRDLIALKPFSVDISTVNYRMALFIDQLGLGYLLPSISAYLFFDYKRFIIVTDFPIRQENKNKKILYGIIFCVILLLLRSPVGLGCEYQARVLLAQGDYRSALQWLNIARFFNPSLNLVEYYHEEIGQALYYLNSKQQTDESRAYLAESYRMQNDYLDAYEELLGSWRSANTPPWMINEFDLTLQGLAEYTHPLRGPLLKRPINDDTALPWIQLLLTIDPNNEYAHYIAGRIAYDLDNYNESIQQMSIVINMSKDNDVLSSAYTYIGLSEIGLGNEIQGRETLFTAIKFDKSYHNNTAREELSGLR